MAPAYGVIPDLVNAGIHAVRGNWVEAGLSAFSAVPVVGDAFAAGRLGVKGGRAIAKGVDDLIDTTRTLKKYDVGPYNTLRRPGSGLDAHHVGQKAVMKKLVDAYNPKTAPAILVPSLGHTRGKEIIARNAKGFDNPRDVLARDIRELRRAYPDIPNSQIQELIQMNKNLYPSMNK